jgi:hypothetical protein
MLLDLRKRYLTRTFQNRRTRALGTRELLCQENVTEGCLFTKRSLAQNGLAQPRSLSVSLCEFHFFLIIFPKPAGGKLPLNGEQPGFRQICQLSAQGAPGSRAEIVQSPWTFADCFVALRKPRLPPLGGKLEPQASVHRPTVSSHLRMEV